MAGSPRGFGSLNYYTLHSNTPQTAASQTLLYSFSSRSHLLGLGEIKRNVFGVSLEKLDSKSLFPGQSNEVLQLTVPFLGIAARAA